MKTSTVLLCSILAFSLLASTQASNKRLSLCWAEPQQMVDLLSVNCAQELTRVMRYNRSLLRRKRYLGCRPMNHKDVEDLHKECCLSECTMNQFLNYCCLH